MKPTLTDILNHGVVVETTALYENEPSLSTILWRYYYSQCKDATQATRLQEQYMNALRMFVQNS